MRFLVDALGEFVVAADPSWISDTARDTLRRNILDSLGCGLAALDGEIIPALREQIDAVGGNPVSTLIGGGRTSAEQATLFNSVLVRYADQLDTYLTPGGLCHPADNFGAILAVAERAGADGADFVLALAIAYEVQCRFSARVPVMAHGLNHALQLAMSVAAGSAKLLGLNAAQTTNAIAAAAADNVSLAAVHSEPVSTWKGISPGITAQRAVYVTDLAARGFTGPRCLFEGPNGLRQLFDQEIDLDLDDRTLNAVVQTYLKKYCSLIHGQAVIDTTLALAREHGIEHRDVDRVRLEVFQIAFDFAGGGTYGDKDSPRTKEQADYNLKYLTAVALIDGQVGPEQLSEERVRRADVQDLLRRVEVRPDDALTRGFPELTPVRVEITLRDGTRYTREQDDFEGAPTRPLSWERTIEKFHWLGEPFADRALREEIVALVRDLDTQPVSALTALLAQVSPEPQRPRTLPAP